MYLQEKFEHIGAKFLSSGNEIKKKLKKVKCFVFDWDGVFNNGVKRINEGSSFAEPDAMGINMLRFSYWLIHNQIPLTVIVTGENNKTAIEFAQREHLDAILLNAKNKGAAITTLTKEYGYSPEQTLFVFDDILDLSAAKLCQLSFCVKRKANPLFEDFIINHNFCHYISAHKGDEYAIREISELTIGLQGNYEQTIAKRIAFDEDYKKYLALRNEIISVSKQWEEK